MTRPPLKTQIAFPSLAACLFGLTLYLLYKISGAPFSWTFMTEPGGGLGWAMRVASIAFWLSVAFVAVRLLNELVFLLFRKRKGYDAPALMRDIFSLVLYVTATTVT